MHECISGWGHNAKPTVCDPRIGQTFEWSTKAYHTCWFFVKPSATQGINRAGFFNKVNLFWCYIVTLYIGER